MLPNDADIDLAKADRSVVTLIYMSEARPDGERYFLLYSWSDYFNDWIVTPYNTDPARLIASWNKAGSSIRIIDLLTKQEQ